MPGRVTDMCLSLSLLKTDLLLRAPHAVNDSKTILHLICYCHQQLFPARSLQRNFMRIAGDRERLGTHTLM